MSNASVSPRAQALLAGIEAWSHAGGVRAVAILVLVTIGGPLVVLAGIAMLVLPGPGLVVIALGLAMLALEYPWARRVLMLMGRALAWARRAVLPSGSTPTRKVIGLMGTAGFFVVTTLLTGAITTFVGSQVLL